MGIVIWLMAGALAFGAGMLMKSGFALRWPVELAIALAAAAVFGLIATAFDFGGWNEPEWRAAVFCFFGAGAVLAVARLARLATR
jgi:peptidoglycan/LPS O-acetylase OafA/YrhL